MNEEFIRKRITELRLQKNVSEYKMSLDLGHSKGYIQSISSGRSLPSMAEFLSLCEYFNITPYDFFNTAEDSSQLVYLRTLETEARKLSNDDIELLTSLAKRLDSGR